MKFNKRDTFFGIFFLILFILILIRNYFFHVSDYSIYWYCDFIAIFFAIGFFFHQKAFLKSITYIGFLPQAFFLISLPIILIFGISILGISPIIKTYHWVFLLISLLMHLSYVFAFSFTMDNKPEIKSLKISAILLLLLYLLSYFFTPAIENINYIFFLEKFFGITGLSFLWLPIGFIGIVVPTYFIQKKIYNLLHKKK